ncbi:MAG: hypothetical protein IPL54_07215 [Chitinophagaceae bacterium]|nr:hypothetical protein [Chitinophagaceae bacterium]
MAKSKKRKHHHDFHPPTHTAKAQKVKVLYWLQAYSFACLVLALLILQQEPVYCG